MGAKTGIKAGSGERPARVPSRLKKGDTVLVIAGREKGKTGKVLRMIPERNRATVERLNIVKRHRRGSGPQQVGGIVEKESPIDVSNLMLVCGRCNKPTRVGAKRLEDGARARTCKRCGETIDR